MEPKTRIADARARMEPAEPVRVVGKRIGRDARASILVHDDTNELITEALRTGLGEVEVIDIECLSSHLQGHAFKYSATNSRIQGVYPYRLTYSDDGGRQTVDVMVKAKPDEADILRVYQGLLDHGGIKLKGSLGNYLRNSDSTPNMKEAVLFRDFKAAPTLPASLGVYLDHDNS